MLRIKVLHPRNWPCLLIWLLTVPVWVLFVILFRAMVWAGPDKGMTWSWWSVTAYTPHNERLERVVGNIFAQWIVEVNNKYRKNVLNEEGKE